MALVVFQAVGPKQDFDFAIPTVKKHFSTNPPKSLREETFVKSARLYLTFHFENCLVPWLSVYFFYN